MRFLKQTKSIDEAFTELFKLGDQVKAAGITEHSGVEASETLLDEFDAKYS